MNHQSSRLSGKVTVGSYLAKRIVESGTNHFFTIPGDFTLALLDELINQPGLNLIGCCNELNAGYAADGYCRATGQLGVVVVTYMVGGLSVINSVAGAYSDDLPLLVVSGGPNSHDGQERHLIHHTIGEIELYQSSKCFEPIVAKTFTIRHLRDASAMIDEAISTCLTMRKPVYLEVACNLSIQQIYEPVPMNFKQMDPKHSMKFASDPETLAIAIRDINEALASSSKPVLIAGSKLKHFVDTDIFIKLVDEIGCGVAITPDAKGLFPENHSNFMGHYWAGVSSTNVQEIVESSDLIICVGVIFNDYTTVGWTALIPTEKSIHINCYSVDLFGRYYPNTNLVDILPAVKTRDKKNSSLVNFNRYSHQMQTQERIDIGPTDELLTMKFIEATLQSQLTSGSSIIVETGDSWFTGQNLRLPDGAKYYIQMQYGSIGWALGASLGIGIANQNRSVGCEDRLIALIGDGAFQVTAQELSTLIRQNVNITIILINNNGYTIEVQIHDGPYNDINDWSYSKLVDVFNKNNNFSSIGIKAETKEQLHNALLSTKGMNGVVLIECCINRDDCSSNLLIWGSKLANATMRE